MPWTESDIDLGGDMTVIDGRPPRNSKRFSWDAVSDRWLRDMLAETCDERGVGDTFTADRANLLAWADRRLGSPLSDRALERHRGVARVLRRWFEAEADDDAVQKIADAMYTRIGGPRRPIGAVECREYLTRRTLSAAFRHELRRVFVSAHRTAQAPTSVTVPVSSRPGVRVLEGEGRDAAREPWPHQRDAWRALDAAAAATGEASRGLVVLPTGSGKTFTMVRWLVERMGDEPDLRVVWLAHQQELLEQAADRFVEEARHLGPDFRRGLRVIASHADRATTIAAGDAQVIVSTWQSLHASWDRQERVLRDYLRAGPCAVVIDEAHRAGAPAYQRVLNVLVEEGRDVVVGLTATPWPQSPGARRRFRSSFPTDLVTVSPEELHAGGVLARPTVHRVDTGEVVRLSESEATHLGDDLPAAVLSRLATASRDDFLVRHWQAQPTRWGKTLVFATGKSHADGLAERFRDAGVTAWSLHSSSDRPRGEVLDEFRDHRGPGVLVSVGMLTEGVDVPDARTAFLARPTLSPVLLRQMIGRVLRGPQAGGTAEAHVVHLRDEWDGLADALDPADAGIIDEPVPEGSHHRGLPPLIVDDGSRLDPRVVRDLESRLRREGVGARVVPCTGISLVGYYDLEDRTVGVLAGQDLVWERILDRAVQGASWRGRSLLGEFDDVAAGAPPRRAIADLLTHVRETGERPPFVPVTLSIDAASIAREVLDLGPMSERERREWFDRRWHEVGRVAFASVQHMIDADGDALAELHREAAGGRQGPHPEVGRPLPSLPRDPDRALPALAEIVARLRVLVDDDIAVRLERLPLPSLGWTRTATSSSFAHYTQRRVGQDLVSAIKVNRALQAPHSIVSDELLAYLVFHELLHHVLPGQGHDAEFRRLEGLWPDADRLDAVLDTLDERYDLVRRNGADAGLRKV